MASKASREPNGHGPHGKKRKRTLQTEVHAKSSSTVFGQSTEITLLLPAIKPRPDWHTVEVPDLPMLVSTDAQKKPVDRQVVEQVHQHAKRLLEKENTKYASSHMSSSSSQKFLSTIMTSGTLSDKISALTLVIQESPLHNMKAFNNLLALARKRSRGQAVLALGALKDLLAQGLVLPEERKLIAFANQPGLVPALQGVQPGNLRLESKLSGGVQDIHLILWAFEDWLKDSYFEILKLLEVWCNDEIEFTRMRAIGYVWELLKHKPEQESNLLRLLVNKLGDPDRKIASKTSHLLLQLQTTHPLMKPIIISSIESEFLFRPGQSSHARYYAIITLNQTILSTKEESVAALLLKIYFSLFVTLLKRRDMHHGPKPATYASRENGRGLKHGAEKGGRASRHKNQKPTPETSAESESTEKLISAVLTGVNRALPFSKTDEETYDSHLDTLFRITHSSNFNTSVQALTLIQQLTSSRMGSSDRFYRTLYESLLDPRLLISSKQAMYLNLLFRSLKADVHIRRVQAFAKRLIQILCLHQPPFICGVLYLLKELTTLFPKLSTMVHEPEYKDGDDDVEKFFDAPDQPSQEDPPVPKGEDEAATTRNVQLRYNGRKRDPEHSCAEKSCLWEILPLLEHFHPSCSMFASKLFEAGSLPEKPDLSHHTLIQFLDRFVYRNPKAANSASRGSSIMQPMAGQLGHGMILSSRTASRSQQPLNSEVFWKSRTEDVAEDTVFFHKYFSQVGKTKSKEKTDKSGENPVDSEGNESDMSEGEDEIWKALVESRPELEADSDGKMDSELEDVDLDEDESDDDNGATNLDEEEQNSAGVAEEEASGEDESSIGIEDEDALLGSDAEVPSDLDFAFNEELETNVSAAPDKGKSKDKSSKKKRKLKHLPTFASAEDYAALLGDDDEIF